MRRAGSRAGLSRPVWAAIVLLAAVCVAGAFWLDAPVREAVVAGQGKGWKRGAEARFHGAVRRAGDWPWLMAAGACGLLAAWRMGRRRAMRMLAAAMLASTVAGLIANTSRLTTGRTRPRAGSEIAQGFYGPWHEGRLLVGESKFNSFPSGHTATAWGFALPFVFAHPWGGLPVVAAAVVISWSSIALGAHHFSDVVVSVFISLGAAVWAWRFFQGRGAAWLDRWLPPRS